MPADVGTQTVLIKHYDRIDSWRVNNRFLDIRPVGIYKGGLMTYNSGPGTVDIHPLVCEISDGSYQVKVQTTTDITVAAANNKYIVLRWNYTGDKDVDYMEALAVTSGNVLDNDLVAGYVFNGVVIYGSADHRRSTPNVQQLTLAVEPNQPTEDSKVFIRGGLVQSGSGYNYIHAQLLDLGAWPGTTRLVYVTPSDGTVESTSDTDYRGKLVLAEVAASASISESDITDVRGFLTQAPASKACEVVKASDYFPLIPANAVPESFVAMPDMILSITTSGGDLLVNFSAGYVTAPGGYTVSRILIDSVEMYRVGTHYTDRPNMHYLKKSLSAGTHEVLIQVWPYLGNVVATLVPNPASPPVWIVNERVLSAIEL